MSKEAISEYFEKKIYKYLDDEFEEYCTCDDYYQPVVEDFELEYRIKNECCKKNGFDFISCEGEGYDDGYEPNDRRGWYCGQIRHVLVGKFQENMDYGGQISSKTKN